MTFRKCLQIIIHTLKWSFKLDAILQLIKSCMLYAESNIPI